MRGRSLLQGNPTRPTVSNSAMVKLNPPPFCNRNDPMKLKKTLFILTSLFAAAFLSTGHAEVYQCETPGGQTLFQDRPCPTGAATVHTETAPDPAVRQNNKHFLWKASSRVNTIHLFGSIHFGSTKMYPLPNVVTQAYDNSDVLVVEVNTQRVDAKAVAVTLLQYGSYPDGESVQRHLPPETWEKLTQAAKHQQLDLTTLQNQKPWLISLSLATLAVQKSGFSPEFGVDKYFITGAERNKPILELESAEQQMTLLSTFSMMEQNRLLVETLDQLEDATTYFRSLLEAWQIGDAQGVKNLIQQGIDTDPDAKTLYEALFTRRNHAMTDKLLKYSEPGKNLFVVVGAGHLVGAEGIVELLRGKGYDVTQL